MPSIKRSPENPILAPNPAVPWESAATYNPSVVEGVDGKIHMFYRATSMTEKAGDTGVLISSIGRAVSKDGIHFTERDQLVFPMRDWEKFGCEDPRVTEFEGKYYIFYTAVSEFSANGIKVARRDHARLENDRRKTSSDAVQCEGDGVVSGADRCGQRWQGRQDRSAPNREHR